jgi:hypothetical protein
MHHTPYTIHHTNTSSSPSLPLARVLLDKYSQQEEDSMSTVLIHRLEHKIDEELSADVEEFSTDVVELSTDVVRGYSGGAGHLLAGQGKMGSSLDEGTADDARAEGTRMITKASQQQQKAIRLRDLNGELEAGGTTESITELLTERHPNRNGDACLQG